ADDAAQMPFHHEADQPFALLIGLGEELFGRRDDRLRIALDLDLRHGFDSYRDTLFRIEVLLRRHVERHELERELAAALHHREDDRSVSLDHARAAESVHYQRLMRTGLPVQTGEHR